MPIVPDLGFKAYAQFPCHAIRLYVRATNIMPNIAEIGIIQERETANFISTRSGFKIMSPVSCWRKIGGEGAWVLELGLYANGAKISSVGEYMLWLERFACVAPWNIGTATKNISNRAGQRRMEVKEGSRHLGIWAEDELIQKLSPADLFGVKDYPDSMVWGVRSTQYKVAKAAQTVAIQKSVAVRVISWQVEMATGLIEGRDQLCITKTGDGKTYCYLLAVLASPGKILIV